MKPEICKLWEEAKNCLEKSEKLYENGKFQEVANEADGAILLGSGAIIKLAYFLGMPDLLEIEGNVYLGWLERREKHYTPKETVEWARKSLKRLSDELPPDTLSPLK